MNIPRGDLKGPRGNKQSKTAPKYVTSMWVLCSSHIYLAIGLAKERLNQLAIVNHKLSHEVLKLEQKCTICKRSI